MNNICKLKKTLTARNIQLSPVLSVAQLSVDVEVSQSGDGEDSIASVSS
jgi:hypothetical protein